MIDSQIINTINKFLFLFFELSLLFIGINFLVQIISQKLSQEKIQNILGGDNSPRSYFMAAVLGSVTPFCTCSTIPMLKGMLKAKVSFGASLTFLFTSPLLNPLIIFLFVSLIGWEITIIYILIALTVSILVSFLLSKFNFQRYLITNNNQEPLSSCSLQTKINCCDSNSTAIPSNSCCSDNTDCCTSTTISPTIKNAWKESIKDFFNLLPYLIISCIIGAITYEYIPTEFLQQSIGKDNPIAIPFAAVIGIPLYIRASVLIPIASILIEKGVSIGAMIALIIGGAGASLPEVILLKSLFKKQLLLAFLITILSMAIFAGYTIQFLFI